MPRYQVLDTILGIAPKDRIWTTCPNCRTEMGLYKPYLPITENVQCPQCKYIMTLEEFTQQSKESKPKMGNTNYDEDEFENEFDVMNPNPYRHEFRPDQRMLNNAGVKIIQGIYKELDHIHKTLALHQEVGNKLRENISHERETTIKKLGESNTMMQQQISGIAANFSEALSKLKMEVDANVTLNYAQHKQEIDTELKRKLDVIDNTLAQVLSTMRTQSPKIKHKVVLTAETFNAEHYPKAIYAFANEAHCGDYQADQCEDDDEHMIYWKDNDVEYEASVTTIMNYARDNKTIHN